MLIESSPTLAWPRRLAHQRSIEAAPLASISMIGTRLDPHRRDVEHQLAIEGKNAFAGSRGQDKPEYEEQTEPRAVTPGDARHHFSSLNGSRDEAGPIARSQERAMAP
jgi:hypothetical protein